MEMSTKGFTLLELMIVILVLALILTVSLPSIQNFYRTAEYRDSVRQLASAVNNARRLARASGHSYDVIIDAERNRFALTDDSDNLKAVDYSQLPADLQIEVIYAAEVSPKKNLAAIRFYPAGGSSGGEIKIWRPSGSGTQLVIDWLLGNVMQEKL